MKKIFFKVLVVLTCILTIQSCQKKTKGQIIVKASSSEITSVEDSHILDTMQMLIDTISLWEDSINEITVDSVLSAVMTTPIPAPDHDQYRDSKYPITRFQTFIESISINGLIPVASLREHDENQEVASWLLRTSPAFFKALLALDDTNLKKIKPKIDSLCENEDSAKTVIEKCRMIKAFMDIYPSLLNTYKYTLAENTTFEVSSFYEFISQTFNDTVAQFLTNNREAVLFWVERDLDGTADLSANLLDRIVATCYPQVASYESLKIKAQMIFQEDHEKRLEPVFFDTLTFQDPDYPPAPSKFDARKRLLRNYMIASVTALADGVESRYEGIELLKVLYSFDSKYFGEQLNYYGLYKNPSENSFSWEPVTLSPSLSISGYGWDDGIHDIGIKLEAVRKSNSKIPVFFTGLPVIDKGKHPSGGIAAKSISRVVVPRNIGRYCREAITTYKIPEGISSIKSLYSVDQYHAIFGDDRYTAPGELSISGQCNEGLIFLPKTDGEPSDTILDYIAQEKSLLFGITMSQDTILFCTDSISGGYGDGSLYMYAARCYDPLFTDANGDGIMDILITTSTGHILMLMKKDGSFQRHEM